MGLDIYLYYIKDRDEMRRKEEIFKESSGKIWAAVGGENNVSPDQRNEVLKALDVLGENLGVDRWGNSTELVKIEEPSSVYPEHLFKIGYFRSSYNDSGFERVLGNLGVGNLSYIFDPGDQYEFRPDWKRALEKTITELALLRTKPPLRCYQMRSDPKTEEINPPEAMEIYERVMDSNKMRGYLGNFSNRDGDFFPVEPMKVRALIRGMTRCFFTGVLEPCVNVVYEVDDNKYYEEALEIVKETCEWVLAKEDPQNYYLRWSG